MTARLNHGCIQHFCSTPGSIDASPYSRERKFRVFIEALCDILVRHAGRWGIGPYSHNLHLGFSIGTLYHVAGTTPGAINARSYDREHGLIGGYLYVTVVVDGKAFSAISACAGTLADFSELQP